MDKQNAMDFDYAITKEWRPVVGWEGMFEVSNFGTIRRVIRCGHGGQVNREISGSDHSKRYRTVCLRGNGRQKTVYMHRLVVESFIGPRPDGMVINHKNGNKQDNRLFNLEYVTNIDNIIHAIEILHSAPYKLTSKDVLDIRCLIKSGKRIREIAQDFGVSPDAIYGIRSRRTWRHVT